MALLELTNSIINGFPRCSCSIPHTPTTTTALVWQWPSPAKLLLLRKSPFRCGVRRGERTPSPSSDDSEYHTSWMLSHVLRLRTTNRRTVTMIMLSFWMKLFSVAINLSASCRTRLTEGSRMLFPCEVYRREPIFFGSSIDVERFDKGDEMIQSRKSILTRGMIYG